MHCYNGYSIAIMDSHQAVTAAVLLTSSEFRLCISEDLLSCCRVLSLHIPWQTCASEKHSCMS